MAIYEYKCDCGWGMELILPFEDMDKPQLCLECGKRAKRILSVMQPPVMKITGNDMALTSLNSKEGAFPPNRYYAKEMEKRVAAGL